MSEIPQKLKPIKTGRLTLREQAFIKANIGSMTIEEISKNLMRRPSVIQDFLNNKTRDGIQVNETLEILRQSHEFLLLKDQLTEQELRIFEKKYSEWVAQFQGDILFSEQNQIFNAIKQDILMSNLMKQRKSAEETLISLDEDINKVRSADIEAELKDDKIMKLRKEKVSLHTIYSAIINQYQEQNKLYNTMLKDLKASRSSRETTQEKKKNDIMSLMDKMADDSQRIQIGEEAELEKLAAEAEEEKYREPTEFLDGTQAIPFISGQD